jgi:hypothetical protein
MLRHLPSLVVTGVFLLQAPTDAFQFQRTVVTDAIDPRTLLARIPSFGGLRIRSGSTKAIIRCSKQIQTTVISSPPGTTASSRR